MNTIFSARFIRRPPGTTSTNASNPYHQRFHSERITTTTHKLNTAAVDALNDPAVRKQLENLGLQMPPRDKLTPAALGEWQKAEIAKWWPMIKAANVKVE